jgi:phosphatidylserine decarboxylase
MFILDPRLFPNFEESIRDNEQYQTTLLTDIGNMYITRIAGLVAPRVHSFISNDENVKQGQVMGVIIFSSMVLLTLPANVKLNIKKGDTAIAGETIIATNY